MEINGTNAFIEKYPEDYNSILINEALAYKMLASPYESITKLINKKVFIYFYGNKIELTIIGIVEDDSYTNDFIIRENDFFFTKNGFNQYYSSLVPKVLNVYNSEKDFYSLGNMKYLQEELSDLTVYTSKGNKEISEISLNDNQMILYSPNNWEDYVDYLGKPMPTFNNLILSGIIVETTKDITDIKTIDSSNYAAVSENYFNGLIDGFNEEQGYLIPLENTKEHKMMLLDFSNNSKYAFSFVGKESIVYDNYLNEYKERISFSNNYLSIIFESIIMFALVSFLFHYNKECKLKAPKIIKNTFLPFAISIPIITCQLIIIHQGFAYAPNTLFINILFACFIQYCIIILFYLIYSVFGMIEEKGI